MVKTMIAMATARPPSNGAKVAASADTRLYAAATGTPKRLDITRALQRVKEMDDLLEAAAGTPGPGRQRAATESAAGQRRITEGGVRRPPGSPWALGGGTGPARQGHAEGGIRLAMTWRAAQRPGSREEPQPPWRRSARPERAAPRAGR